MIIPKSFTNHEILSYIRDRIRMILKHNIDIKLLVIFTNKKFSFFIIKIIYNSRKKENLFFKKYKLNVINLDKNIDMVINDFDQLMN